MSAAVVRRVWTVPVALAVLTVFGLLAALLGTGIWHALAWAALAAPVGVGVCFAIGRRQPMRMDSSTSSAKGVER